MVDFGDLAARHRHFHFFFVFGIKNYLDLVCDASKVEVAGEI